VGGDGSITGSEEGSVWKLTFDTGAYYGAANKISPEVVLTFFVKDEEHYRVPLLLRPIVIRLIEGAKLDDQMIWMR